METRQVLLICLQPLLSEGLRRIFARMEDVDLVQPPCAGMEEIERLLTLGQPDLVVVAAERESAETERLITMLLNLCDEVPIIWAGLDETRLHVYSSRIMPANTASLTDLIQHTPLCLTNRKKIPSHRV